jgi:glycosidase
MDYIARLGVNLLWLTPIFAAPSNHKYDTTDYDRIDPHFGDEAIFARLLTATRQRGIRLILDGVFNHAGLGFAPWQDVMAHGAASPYWSWFEVDGTRPDPKARNYRTFGHSSSMPRLRTANPEVQAYLIERMSRWMRMGVAGWRLDVADEVDMDFWRAFRREMRAIDPEAYFVGEIGYNAARWLQGDQFDGVMHYPLRQALLQFVAPPGGQAPGAPASDSRLDAVGFQHALGQMRSWYPGWATTANLNPLSTHDVPRFLTAVGGDVRRWRLGMIFLLTSEGIPLLYYGDEIGLDGGYDPDCRRPMIWDPAKQNAAMLAETRGLVRLRHEFPALRASGFRPLATGHPAVAAYLRGTSGAEEIGAANCPEGAVVLVALNAGDASVELELVLGELSPGEMPLGGLAWPGDGNALDLLTGTVHSITDGTLRLRLPALDGAVLVPA